MSAKWQKAYTELTDFTAKHPEIHIGASSLDIPREIRPEYYRLFNAVREAFIKENVPGLLDEANSFSRHYLQIESELVRRLELEEITAKTSIYRFLHNPGDRLTRELYEPLFDLLKGKAGIQTFEERMLRLLDYSMNVLCRQGYEKWVILALARLLEPDQALSIVLEKMEWNIALKMSDNEAGEDVPAPQETRYLSFDHSKEMIFAVPDFIIYSTAIRKYVSFRSDYDIAMFVAANASERRTWDRIDQSMALEPGVVLVYIADNARDLSLVADVNRICRPDLLLECRGERGWYEQEKLERIRLHHDALKPELGTIIVSREAQAGLPEAGLEQGITIISAGFEVKGLEAISTALTKQGDRAK